VNRLDRLWEALDDLTDWLLDHPELPASDGTRLYAADLGERVGFYYDQDLQWVRAQEMQRRRLREKLNRTNGVGRTEAGRANR
jgi:hypothetical protein